MVGNCLDLPQSIFPLDIVFFRHWNIFRQSEGVWPIFGYKLQPIIQYIPTYKHSPLKQHTVATATVYLNLLIDVLVKCEYTFSRFPRLYFSVPNLQFMSYIPFCLGWQQYQGVGGQKIEHICLMNITRQDKIKTLQPHLVRVIKYIKDRSSDHSVEYCVLTRPRFQKSFFWPDTIIVSGPKSRVTKSCLWYLWFEKSHI